MYQFVDRFRKRRENIVDFPFNCVAYVAETIFVF